MTQSLWDKDAPSLALKVARHAQNGNTSSMHFDGYISILAMPIGVAVCFGPALLVWVMAELKDSANDSTDGSNAP
jgi:hypothetical protein